MTPNHMSSNKSKFTRKKVRKRWVYKSVCCIILLIIGFHSYASDGFVNDLRRHGFSLIPSPQKTALTGQVVVVDNSWMIDTTTIVTNFIFESLKSKAMELYGINFSAKGECKIILDVRSGSITEGLAPELAKQAYRLDLAEGQITITGNTDIGLFYGVQSLLQLLKPTNGGTLSLPEGSIVDWPDLELRILHWDTKHYQDRIETLKRYIDQSAYFKANAIAFEIEDKYEYPSHPIIGAPGAFTLEAMQELTAYALQRFIQLIPDVQSPAHMTYVLKHEEFAHLRSDGNNYQVCMCNEEAIELIFDMYQDMIDATPGVEYFLASTDEVYFAGMCGKCTQEYNDKNRSQAWVGFIHRANDFMTERGRKMISWIEYPLLPGDIHKLLSTMIDGVISDGKEQLWIDEENKMGIRQLNYNSIQGSEYLFPNYFPTTYRDKAIEGNLRNTAVSSANVLEKGANLMGSFTAAWGDAGLHNELFWLGWVTGVQYSWSVGQPAIEQSTADFMDAFYGYKSPDMAQVYCLLEEGARFYQELWDNVVSKERPTGYGNSYGKGIGAKRYDQTLESLPFPGLSSEPVFSKTYASKIEKAKLIKKDSEKLISLLMQSLSRVDRNRYNLEILISIAYLEQYTINTLLDWVRIEEYLLEASNAGSDYAKAVRNMVEAHNLAGEIVKKKVEVANRLTTTWEKSRFRKCRSVDGKDFVLVLDDVKDHLADRRLGLSYMWAPFERMKIEKWQNQLMMKITDFAKVHRIAVKGLAEEPLNE